MVWGYAASPFAFWPMGLSSRGWHEGGGGQDQRQLVIESNTTHTTLPQDFQNNLAAAGALAVASGLTAG